MTKEDFITENNISSVDLTEEEYMKIVEKASTTKLTPEESVKLSRYQYQSNAQLRDLLLNIAMYSKSNSEDVASILNYFKDDKEKNVEGISTKLSNISKTDKDTLDALSSLADYQKRHDEQLASQPVQQVSVKLTDSQIKQVGAFSSAIIIGSSLLICMILWLYRTLSR